MKNSSCPGCRSKLLLEDKQPARGTHAFSRIYKCGSQVVYVIGSDYWEWETPCPTLDLTDNTEIGDGK